MASRTSIRRAPTSMTSPAFKGRRSTPTLSLCRSRSARLSARWLSRVNFPCVCIAILLRLSELVVIGGAPPNVSNGGFWRIDSSSYFLLQVLQPDVPQFQLHRRPHVHLEAEQAARRAIRRV